MKIVYLKIFRKNECFEGQNREKGKNNNDVKEKSLKKRVNGTMKTGLEIKKNIEQMGREAGEVNESEVLD